MLDNDKIALVLDTIKLPLSYDPGSGMVFDADMHHVLDIRGWGRISKLDNPEARQDAIGEFVIQAINGFFTYRRGDQTKSEELFKAAAQEENESKAMGMYIKANRQERSEDFRKDILPQLIEKEFYVECDEYYTKYTIDTGSFRFGIIDFFPKKNRVLIRKDNNWVTGGKQWVINHLLKG